MSVLRLLKKDKQNNTPQGKQEESCVCYEIGKRVDLHDGGAEEKDHRGQQQ